MPYTINGQIQPFDEPVVQDNTTFVPLGNIVDVMGGFVEWDNLSKTATVEMNSRRFKLQDGSTQVESDGYQAEMQAAPFIQDDKLWVPVRFFENILGGSISVNGTDVTINRPA